MEEHTGKNTLSSTDITCINNKTSYLCLLGKVMRKNFEKPI